MSFNWTKLNFWIITNPIWHFYFHHLLHKCNLWKWSILDKLKDKPFVPFDRRISMPRKKKNRGLQISLWYSSYFQISQSPKNNEVQHWHFFDNIFLSLSPDSRGRKKKTNKQKTKQIVLNQEHSDPQGILAMSEGIYGCHCWV